MGKLEELKELSISKTTIEEIPSCIGSLKGLIYLDFSRCEKLQLLPREMGKLEELKELNISETFIEEIPPCIGSLKKLEILHAHGCESLVGLPSSISHLVNLSTLNLSMCISLNRLPESREGDASHWETLMECAGNGLYNAPIAKTKLLKLSNLPSTIGKLGNLEELHASYCRSLGGEIPIDGLSSLKILVLSWTGISSFPDKFDKLSHLEKLDLRGCKMLQSLPESTSMSSSLQHLLLTDCYELQSLPEFPSYLTVLEVTCHHRTIPQLSHLIHLKEITIYKCKLLESMPELPSTILKLFVYGCDELKELPSLSGLKLLSQLDIQNCRELTEIKGLEALKSLIYLSVSGSKKLSKFDGLEHAESLRYLDMSFSLVIDDLVQAQGLGRLKNLEELDISCCEYLIRPDLSQLTHLIRLYAKNCHNLVEIKGLDRLKKLEWLNIQGCTSIETLPDLCFENLKILDFWQCSELRHQIVHICQISKI
ncbi:hypothetical protein BT93_D0533 [Corymbia citriodora subsp. variegata]|nr:hypothetical protein BT93_D0533 [Corymbia citriodora subsp. variegata]